VSKRTRKHTSIDTVAYRSKNPHRIKPAVGRVFAADRLPLNFTTVIDPDKHPPQPWRDLPPPTGEVPFHLSLENILTPETMASINDSGTLVFHSVGDTGGVNTPTQDRQCGHLHGV